MTGGIFVKEAKTDYIFHVFCFCFQFLRWSSMNCRNFRGEEWEELASNLNNRCSFIACKDVKNGEQCSYKMSNLKRKYKNEKELLRLRGGVSEQKWFCRMEYIFSSHPKYLWYVVYAGRGAERLDKDAANNTMRILIPAVCKLARVLPPLTFPASVRVDANG
ncbi:hypothetical protein O6H91_17G016900 [Diphasiastrum complanatum]|uniref:Uncharacterized protein n=2 Tax=Diphasiastrum complanatum TaxID=34168 RepID=A0ACC2B4G6_DIPCM|nr:hypothetical protein O6H91_17G016500 [Diphasiastrum complanatum]KAJ7524693.1 hypothetical protein O6H91_17G016900 [Diphasiastrum complanatum]